MAKPPSPTTLRPPPPSSSGINRKVIVIAGIVILVIGGFAVSQMYLVDDDRLKTKDPGMHINLNNDDFLKDAPVDYSWMKKSEPVTLAAPSSVTGTLAGGVAMPEPPPPPPNPPIQACRRPSVSYATGDLESAYDETMEYRECRQLAAYEIALREYYKKFPVQPAQGASPIGGRAGGQLVSASSHAPATSPPPRRMSVAASASGGGSNGSTSSNAQATAPVENIVQASSLYHEGSLEELPLDECVIPAGSDIPATLAKDVNVSQPGSARIVVTRDVLDYTGQNVAIPYGSQIVVSYKGDLKYGQERAQIGSTILTLPNGMTMSLDGLSGYDPTGQTGLPIDVDNHNWALFGTAVLVGIIDAIPAIAGSSTNVEISSGVDEVTSTGQLIVERELSRPPTAEPIVAGTELLITLDKHIVMGECYE